MKLLLIDLDSTLIDLTVFKSHLFSQLEELHQIPKDQSVLMYNSVKLFDMWPEHLIQKLHEEYKVPAEELEKLLESCFSKITLMENSLNYLRKFEGKKYIFSFGGYDLQMRKIKQFHLEKEVDGVFITLQKKIEYLKTFIDQKKVAIDGIEYEDVTIVDDDKVFLDAVNVQYRWIKTIDVTDLV